jgi:hypothetical protein
MKLIQYGRGPLRPDLEKAARTQIEQAAGTTARQSGMREHLHQCTAASHLATVWFAGQHHLVEADDWPDTLPVVVLSVIRQAPAINDDPTMRNLRDTGGPHRWPHTRARVSRSRSRCYPFRPYLG